MKAGHLGGIILACLMGTAVHADGHTTTEGLVAQCAKRTHAPGTYVVTEGVIAPGSGGTARGAANISDCIADLRGIQYGTVPGGTVATAAVDGVLTEEACKERRDNSIAAGLAATVVTVAILGPTDPVLAGAAGGTIGGIAGLNRKYRECLSRVRNGVVTAQSAVPVYACSRNSNPFVGGRGYCQRR